MEKEFILPALLLLFLHISIYFAAINYLIRDYKDDLRTKAAQ